MKINIKRKDGGGVGAPSSLVYGEMAVDGEANVYIGDDTNSVVQVAAKNNFNATTDPTATDDSSAGYTEGSLWINTVEDTEWKCVDATATAAIWKITTLQDGDVPLDLYVSTSDPVAPDEGDVWLKDESGDTVIKYRDTSGSNQTVATEASVVTLIGENTKQNNDTATTDPTATDDSSAGYEVGSTWTNITEDTEWTCVDATASAAVWKLTTLQSGDVPLDLYVNTSDPVAPSEADIWLLDEPSTVLKYRDSGGSNQTVATMNTIVEAVTANETLAITDSGHTFTNEGATGTVTLTLPTASAGLNFTFVIQAAQTFTIAANLSDTIRYADIVSAAAGDVSAGDIGNVVRVEAINATEWIVTNLIGTWTVT
jgi:predicted RNA-binding protein with PUA-like domain